MFHSKRLVSCGALLPLVFAACSSSSSTQRPPRDAGTDARVTDAHVADAHTDADAVGDAALDASESDARGAGAAGGEADAGHAAGAGGAGGMAGGGGTGGAGGAGGSKGPKNYWKPKVGSTWQIQYADELDTSVDVEIFDIDVYETSVKLIDELHAKGRKVICYFDTAYEAWRPDAKKLEPFRGNPLDGWPDQYWVDIRAPEVFEVMLTRLDMARDKHCDGVDPDDVDASSNNSGFPLTAMDQQTFIKKIAAAAHERGMAVGLKNDLEDIPFLIDHVDFAVNEECFQEGECKDVQPFIKAGKPVFNVEYTEDSLQDKAADICPQALAFKFSTLVKRLNLNAEFVACEPE
jgi:endo-alpha-1,4-polygalactosaminidase (GH114 family)